MLSIVVRTRRASSTIVLRGAERRRDVVVSIARLQDAMSVMLYRHEWHIGHRVRRVPPHNRAKRQAVADRSRHQQPKVIRISPQPLGKVFLCGCLCFRKASGLHSSNCRQICHCCRTNLHRMLSLLQILIQQHNSCRGIGHILEAIGLIRCKTDGIPLQHTERLSFR